MVKFVLCSFYDVFTVGVKIFKVNVAMGISLYNPSYDESVENVFKRADKAMYEKKREMKQEKVNE